jgi:hypothetical protein
MSRWVKDLTESTLQRRLSRHPRSTTSLPMSVKNGNKTQETT